MYLDLDFFIDGNAIGPSSTFESGVPPNPRRGEQQRCRGGIYAARNLPRQPVNGKRRGLPPSLAPLVRDSFTAVCRGRACPARSLAITTPFSLCIVGRGLDRLTAHNERRQPAKLARSCGCLPCRGKHCSLPDFAPLNRGPTLTTPHLRGASGTPPPTIIRRASHYRKRPRRPGGRPALHPTLPHSVGRAFAHNSFTPPCRGRACPARSLAITTPYPLHRRAASHRAFA